MCQSQEECDDVINGHCCCKTCKTTLPLPEFQNILRSNLSS